MRSLATSGSNRADQVKKMLSFACRNVEIEELLRCSFDLNKTEYSVLNHLIRSGGAYGASALGKAMRPQLDRTTVQKAVKSLTEKSLIFRQQRNLSSGGYTFSYRVKDKRDIKKRMLSVMEKWHDNVARQVERW